MKKKKDEELMNTLRESLLRFIRWLDANGYASYDHYDLWASEYGIFSRRVFAKNKLIGIPLVGSLQLVDMFFPYVRKFVAKKAISAEAMPYFAIGFFRLFELYGEEEYLRKGVRCLEWLKENSVKTASGIGWGLHFDWENKEFIPKGTACVTLTAYSQDAFLYGYKLLKDKTYLDMATGIAEFVYRDLNKKIISSDTVAVSYTPICGMFVANANSYAAKILYDAGEITGKTEYMNLGRKIVNYILSQQNKDGSWYYWDRSAKDNFIDSFHTAFILENLFNVFEKDHDPAVREAIFKGYNFYKEKFLDNSPFCRHYHVYKVPTGIKVDTRSQAEAIYCLSVLSDVIPEAREKALSIASWTIKHMQNKKGFFYFRKFRTHTVKMPYMRWAEAPMFNALTYLLCKFKNLKTD
ncbi:MAG: hypothetical protein PHW46_01705 [Candidatus Omnitrophica bacterium]|nr:hypothetical protein [Candidatus Omnitrophota bacterium]